MSTRFNAPRSASVSSPIGLPVEATLRHRPVDTATVAELRNTLASARVRFVLGDFAAVREQVDHILEDLDRLARRRPAQAGDTSAEVLRASTLAVRGITLARLHQAEESRKALETAVDLFRSMPEAVNESHDAHSDYGVALAALGHAGEALDHLRAAVQQGPATLEARRQLGLCLVQREQYAEAERWLLQVAQVQPGDEQVAQSLALALERQGKASEAAATHRDLGILLLNRTELSAARESLDRSLALVPADALAMTARGEIDRLEGRLAAAIACFEDALRLEPNLPPTLASLAVAYYDSGRYPDALEKASAAMGAEPHPSFLSVIAQSLVAMGRLGEALRALETPLVEDNLELRVLRAAVLEHDGQVERALTELTSLTNLHPDSVVADVALAGALIRHGRRGEAVEPLRRVLAIDPDALSALELLIEALFGSDGIPEQLALAERAISVAERTNASPSDRAWLWGNKGRLLLDDGQSQAAVEALERAVAIAPDEHGTWHELLALGLTLVGRPQDALDTVEKVAGPLPDSAMLASVQGLAHSALGHQDEAIERLQHASALGSTLTIVATELVGLLMEVGRTEEALEAAQKARTFNADDEGLLVLTSKLLRAADRATEAAEMLRPAADQPGAGHELLEELGECYLVSDRNDEALQIFDRVLAKDPDSGLAAGSRGQALLQLGRSEAIQALREGAAKTDNAPWVVALLAEALRRAGEYDEALQLFEQLVQRSDARQAWIFGFAGNLYADIGEFATAARLLQEAVTMDSRLAWVFAALGWARENLGFAFAGPALDAYRRAHELEPDNPNFLKGMGNALLLAGERKQAHEHYGRAIVRTRGNLHPDVETKCMLGWCHYQLGEYDEAQRLYLSALASDADEPSAQFDLALILMRMGHYSPATAEYGRALELLAKVHRLRQRAILTVAITDFEEAIRDDAASRQSEQMREILARLQAAALASGVHSSAEAR